MSATLLAVHPVLMSSDVSASIAFYSLLGFDATFQDPATAPTYAAVTRDDVTLHLQWNADASDAPGRDRPVYRFLVTDVDDLFRAFRSTGALPDDALDVGPWSRPGDTPWGTRELHLRDPDGNGLQFYRPR